MTIFPPPPSSIEGTMLFSLLNDKSKPKDGLAEKTLKFIEYIQPLLDLIISGPFRDYTLHNPNHSKKLVHLAQHVIHRETINNLDALECAVIIMCCYLHDIGLSLTSTERARIISSPPFEHSLSQMKEIWSKINDNRERLKVTTVESDIAQLEIENFQLFEVALSNYLRPLHASKDRYVEFINMIKNSSGRSDLFEIDGVSFEEELIEICVSHNLNAGVLIESKSPHEDRFPQNLVLGGHKLNSQFCAAVLRIVDILDFDRERTPNILFESLSISSRSLPGAEVSLREWNKHMSVHTLSIDGEELLVSADCKHPSIEKSVREFCNIIERELRDTLAVLRRNPNDIARNYIIDIPIIIRPRIRSIGYTFKNFVLHLNESAIINLLMGEKLYSHPGVALRELIQNSLDACEARRRIGKEPNYIPSISIVISSSEDNRSVLTVQDNGIGMDEYVLSEFYFKIGNSYYGSNDFKNLLSSSSVPNFTSISRFGIGVLSVFMMGDVLEVETKNNYSPRKDLKLRKLRIEGKTSIAFVTEQNDGPHGTLIRLFLKSDLATPIEKYISYLKNTIIRPSVPISISYPLVDFTVTENDDAEHTKSIVANKKTINLTLKKQPYFSLRPLAIEELKTNNIEPVVIDLERFSDLLEGRVVIFFAVLNNGKLSFSFVENQDAEFETPNISKNDLTLGQGLLKQYQIFKDYSGNRITVNGFAMNMKKTNRIMGTKNKKITFAFDIEVKGTNQVIYDVSRDRIIGDGAIYVKKEFRTAIIRGLEQFGLFDKFTEKTKMLINQEWTESNDSFKVDEIILEQICSELLKDVWHSKEVKTVSSKLKIKEKEVWLYVKELINRKKISKPIHN